MIGGRDHFDISSANIKYILAISQLRRPAGEDIAVGLAAIQEGSHGG